MRKIWIIIGIIVVLGGCTRTRYSWGIGYYPGCWSPDRKKVYYFKTFMVERITESWRPLGGEEHERSYIWYIGKCNPDGSNPNDLVEIDREDFSWDVWPWPTYGCMDISPSGKIVFSVRGNNIYMVDTTGENLHKILDWGSMPRWAFNYTKIVFQGDKEHPGIWLADPDGSNAENILKEGVIPAFCDANKKIVYFLIPDPPYPEHLLITYSFADSTIDTLNPWIWGQTYADWNVNGDNIVYLNDTCYSYIYDCNTRERKIMLFGRDEISSHIIRWQPGTEILAGSGDLWIISPDGSEKRKILSFENGEGRTP